MKTVLIAAAAAFVGALATNAQAAPPALKTPAPVIYLADNLDEVDNLGWCIDTLGRGFSEQLQVHSCKPQGGDVQFSYDAESQQISSVPFSGKCVALSAANDAKVPFGLLDCAPQDPTQQFVYDAASGQIAYAATPDMCLAAGAASRSAGPFLSRDLILAPCASTDPRLITWVVAE